MIFLIDYKTLNEIIVELISNIHANIPEADTKIGTFLRDAIIDPFSLSLSKLYTQMKKMEMGQSILTAIGNDLEALAANFFIYRKSGSKSVGKVRFYIANTLLSDMDYAPKYQDIYIPKGTKVVAKYSNNTIPIQFETMVATSIKGDTVYYLNRDQTGYKYVEILCKSVNTGYNTNIGRYEINAMANNNISGIYSVSNYEKFKNGADDENDESLALRVGLALFANNIGTKNGYLSFILKQPQVIDAKIVAAGDKEMKRDIVTVVDDDGNLKEINMGGCVDVYVRTNTESSDTMNITVESSNIKTDGSVVVDINSALEEIPIITVQTITGSRDENGIIKYTTYTENDNEAGYNYRVYTDTKENENMKGSCKEKSYVEFKGTIKPRVGDKLTIAYVFNDGIKVLQELVDTNKSLTADVLIRTAEEVKINTIIDIKISKLYNLYDMKDNIKNSFNSYINGKLKMGSSIDITDIIHIVKLIDGVKTINIDDNKIGFIVNNSTELQKIVTCTKYQYLTFDDSGINVSYES